MASTFDLSVIFRAIDKMSPTMQKMQGKLDAFAQKAQKIGDSMQRVGKSMMTYVTLPILGLGTAMVRTAGVFEQYQASFEVLLGSAEKGKKLFEDITQLSAGTPFELGDLAESSRMMLNFGIASEDIISNLKMLGDVAGADKNKLKSLTLAFSQVQSTGRLMGQDLLQMINAGFNPLQIISEQTGKSMAELKDAMSKGAISAEMVADAFKVATSEGGRFYQNMQKQSMTFFGRWSTMMDNLKIMLKGFGDILLPMATKVINKIIKVAQWIDKLNPKAKKMILIFLAIAAAMGPLIFATGKVISMVGKFANVLKFILTPQGLLIVGIIVLIIAWIVIIITVIKNWGKITGWLSKNIKGLIDYIKRMPRILFFIAYAMGPLIFLPLMIIRNWEILKNFFTNLFLNIGRSTVNGVNILGEMWFKLIEWISKKLEEWGITEFFTKLWMNIVSAFITAVDKIKEIWGEFTKWAKENPVLKWLFETQAKKTETNLKKKTKEEEKKKEEKDKKENKDKFKDLLNMEDMFKNFKGGKVEKNTVYVNVKVTAEEGSLATVEKVGGTKNVKKKVISDSNYTGRSF